MILIIILLEIFFLLSLIFFMICLSNLEVEIKQFDFNSSNLNKKKIENYLIYIRIKLLRKITWLKFTIDDKKISKIRNFKNFNVKVLKKMLIQKEKEIFTIKNIKHIQEFEIDEFNLKMKVDTIDTIFTSFVVAIISTLVSIILSRNTKKYNKEKYTYTITPVYKESMQIIIKLNCIINVKMVHIINILYMLLKKRSVVYD